MRNGKIIAFHAYLNDVDAFHDALRRLALHGIAEADAQPILSA